MSDAASVLYPSTPTAAAATLLVDPPPATPTAEAETSDAARALYGKPEPLKVDGIPAHIAELRNDPLRKLYSGDSTYGTQPIIDDAMAEVPEEVRLAVESEVREMGMDVGASPVEFQQSVQLATTLYKNPPTAEQVGEWRQTALAQLKASYGDGWKGALADAQKLVQRDPRLAALLDRNGLGDHPQMVERLVNLARAQKLRGKL